MHMHMHMCMSCHVHVEPAPAPAQKARKNRRGREKRKKTENGRLGRWSSWRLESCGYLPHSHTSQARAHHQSRWALSVHLEWAEQSGPPAHAGTYLYCTFSLLGEKGEGVVFSRPLRALRAA